MKRFLAGLMRSLGRAAFGTGIAMSVLHPESHWWFVIGAGAAVGWTDD